MMTPQAQTILTHLRKVGSITNIEAQAVYKCRSVSSRISEIDRTYLCKCVRTYHKDFTGQRYVRYTLPAWVRIMLVTKVNVLFLLPAPKAVQ